MCIYSYICNNKVSIRWKAILTSIGTCHWTFIGQWCLRSRFPACNLLPLATRRDVARCDATLTLTWRGQRSSAFNRDFDDRIHNSLHTLTANRGCLPVNKYICSGPHMVKGRGIYRLLVIDWRPTFWEFAYRKVTNWWPIPFLSLPCPYPFGSIWREGTGLDGAWRDGTGRDRMWSEVTGRDGTGRDGTGRDVTCRDVTWYDTVWYGMVWYGMV